MNPASSNLPQDGSFPATDLRLPVAPPGVEHLTSGKIVDPGSDFYPRIVSVLVQLAGHDQRVTDWQVAIGVLNRELALGLSEDQCSVLRLMFTGLTQTQRFRGQVNLELALGDHSAIHTAHSAVLASELFRRAGLLEESKQTEDVTLLRTHATLGILMHDMGEMFGEVTSHDERNQSSTLVEANEIEGEIFQAVLRLAIWAVENNNGAAFYKTLTGLQSSIRGQSAKLSEISSQLAELNSKPLNCSGLRTFELFKNGYDIVENHEAASGEPTRRLLGLFAKTVERIQGTRHFTRFGTKDRRASDGIGIFNQNSSYGVHGPRESIPAAALEIEPGLRSIPIIYYDSSWVYSLAERLEGNLPGAFANARTDEERRLARALRDCTYHTFVEWFNVGPYFYSLQEPQVDQTVSKLSKRAQKLVNEPETRNGVLIGLRIHLLEKMRRVATQYRAVEDGDLKPSRDTDRHLPIKNNVIRRSSLMALYLHAIESDYIPQGTSLLGRLKDGVPTELHPGLEQSLIRHRERISAERAKVISKRRKSR